MPVVTLDMLMNVENYGELFYRHLPHLKFLEILSEFESVYNVGAIGLTMNKFKSHLNS